MQFIRIFLLSFAFAYNGGFLQLISDRISLHTYQLLLVIIGFILSFNWKYIKSSYNANKTFICLFFFLILFFHLHISTFTPLYGAFKIRLLWWNFAIFTLIIFSIKNFKEFRLFILYGVFQIAIGILLNGFDLSSYRTGAGEPISSGRLGGILLAFGLFYKDSRLKYFRILIGLMGLFFIILSGTRTLYVSFAIIILFFLIYDTKKGRIKISRKSFKKGFLALIGIISIILVLNFNIFKVNSELIDRFYSAFESLSGFSAYDNSTYYRSLQWNSSIEIWRENPIVGSGLGGFAYSWSFADIREYPHNIFLELLAEGGVIAIGLFVGMLSIIWRLVREKSKYLPVYINAFSLSLFLLGLITSLTSLEFPNQFILFLSFILIVTSSNILHNESKMLSQKSLSSNHYHISEN